MQSSSIYTDLWVGYRSLTVRNCHLQVSRKLVAGSWQQFWHCHKLVIILKKQKKTSYEFLDMATIFRRNFCLSVSLSLSIKAVAQRNALHKKALRGDTRRELSEDDLDTVSQMHSPYGAMIYFKCGDIYPLAKLSLLFWPMWCIKFWITWNLLFALTFRRRVRFLSIVRAWNVSERGPRFCTGNCDASRRDDDTTMSSTSYASTRKTVSGQDVRRPYPNRNSIAKREGRRNIEWKGNEGKIRENERKRCVSTSSVVRRAGFFITRDVTMMFTVMYTW